MMVPWDVWLGVAAIAIGVATLMATGARRLRAARGIAAKGATLCASAVLLSTALAGLFFWQSHEIKDLAQALQDPAPPVYLSPDWGAQFSPEDKSRYSRLMASVTFVDWGIRVHYFDADGIFRKYQPTDEDRAHRMLRLRYIERTRVSGDGLFWAGLGLIVVPWLGLAYALRRKPD